MQFIHNRAVVLNQNKMIKRDTVVYHSGEKYHSYVQVNPTTFKVYRSSYNEDGLEVENLYYDNIVNVNIFSGSRKIFSKDFRKSDFKRLIPYDVLKQCVLSDIKLYGLDSNGLKYHAQLAIPDSPSSYIVNVVITYKGRVSMDISQD